MHIIDEMWQHLNEVVSKMETTGKICVPITGGLDSRVLAGLLLKNNKRIDLSYIRFNDDNYCNVGYALYLGIAFHVKDFRTLFVNNKNVIEVMLNDLSKQVNLKEYTLIQPLHMDFYTGLHYEPRKMFRIKKYEREYWDTVPKKIAEYKEIYERYFNRVISPFDTKETRKFFESIPGRYKIMQYAYRQMIRKYLHGLYDIPRCYDRTKKPIRLDHYYLDHAKHYLGIL